MYRDNPHLPSMSSSLLSSCPPSSFFSISFLIICNVRLWAGYRLSVVTMLSVLSVLTMLTVLTILTVLTMVKELTRCVECWLCWVWWLVTPHWCWWCHGGWVQPGWPAQHHSLPELQLTQTLQSCHAPDSHCKPSLCHARLSQRRDSVVTWHCRAYQASHSLQSWLSIVNMTAAQPCPDISWGGSRHQQQLRYRYRLQWYLLSTLLILAPRLMYHLHRDFAALRN